MCRIFVYGLLMGRGVKTKHGIMKAYPFTAKSPELIRPEIEKAIESGFVPAMAFVFTSVKLGIGAMSKAFKNAGFPVLGCSTSGNILAGIAGNSSIYEDAAVVTLVSLRKEHFACQHADRGILTSFEFGQELGSWGAKVFKKPAFILLASGLSLDGQELINGILDKAGDETIMFGGLAGDDARFKKTFVFSGNAIYDNGAAIMALDTDFIDVHGLATSGWIGLGKDLTVTRAEGNVVYCIDHEPALEVYKKYLSVDDKDLPAIGVEYPLLIKREDGSESLRAVMGVDRKARSLIFAGSVPQDATVSFSSSPGFEVMESTREQINQFHAREPKADVMLLFSCVARHLALGPVITEELSYPAGKWGKPLPGFFTYGEIGTNYGSKCDFYNQTYTLVLMKEKT